MAARLTFTVLGDTLIDRTLENYAEAADDATPLWNRLADRFARSEALQFSSQGAYGGAAYPALSPSYAAWKLRRYGAKPILQASGDLMASLTSRPFGVEVISPHYMALGTAIDYASYHQSGSGSLPRRPPVALPESERAAWVREMQMFLRTGRTR